MEQLSQNGIASKMPFAPVQGRDYGAITYDATYLSSVSKGDLVYLVFTSPNLLVSYDSKTFKILKIFNLPGKPTEIQIVNEELYISFSDLEYISV